MEGIWVPAAQVGQTRPTGSKVTYKEMGSSKIGFKELKPAPPRRIAT